MWRCIRMATTATETCQLGWRSWGPFTGGSRVQAEDAYFLSFESPFIAIGVRHVFSIFAIVWPLAHRYERSGTMHGLFRVRGFTQDDAHIFCLPDQVREIRRIMTSV
jgi:hypothetical protein